MRKKVEELVTEYERIYSCHWDNSVKKEFTDKILALIEPLQAGRKKGMENMADKELKEKKMDEMLTDTADLIVMQYLAPHAFDEIFDRLIRKGWRKL